MLVTAGTKSSDPMQTAALLARDRATIVAVGDVGLDLDRRPLYQKELTVKVSRAYGPGRYDPTYEDLGIDYPIGYVRWPIARNLEAVMGLIASGRLEVTDLITHRFPFDRAVEAYDVFDSGDPYLGILLEYGHRWTGSHPVGRSCGATRRAAQPHPGLRPGSSAPAGSHPACFCRRRTLPASDHGPGSPRPGERRQCVSEKPTTSRKRSRRSRMS